MIDKLVNEGKLVPDSIVNSLIEKRLTQDDCRINGWVLEGYPLTEEQFFFMNALRLAPT